MRKTSLIKATLFVLAIIANINYLIFILNPAHADNLGFFVVTGLADTLTVVIFVSTWATALYYELSKARYQREMAELRKLGKHLLRQKVAVLITVVSEDLTIVKHTLQSAKALIGEKAIYLLDDGKRPETAALASQIGVYYITRETNAGYKAGNINNALRYHVRERFCIVIDADFALHPEFIQRTLPLFADPRVAAVQTPQVYSNEETLFAKGCKHLQDFFYTYLQPAKHLLNSAFCVGTNVIFSNRALQEIDGLAEMHSEDVFTTLRLLERGYKVSFLNEQLAVGLSPTTLISFYTQQYRWARGGFLMMFKHNTLFNRKLNLEQRLQFFLSNLFYLSGIAVLIYLLSPLIAILLNIKPINDASFGSWLTAYIPFFCANFLFFMALMKKHRLSSFILGIFSFVPYLSALRSELFGLSQFKWKVTNARSKGLITRLLAPYIIFLVLACAIFYFLVTRALSYNPALIFYYVWLAVDILIVALFIVRSYAATSRTTIPAFEQHDPLDISTAEILAFQQQTERLVTPQFARQPVKIDDLPTSKLPAFTRRHHN